MADDRAPHRPVPAGVHRPGVVGFQAHIVDLVVLDDVVVAAESDGHVRGVVDKVVRRPVADAAQRDGGCVHAVPSSVVMDMVILGDVSAGGERRTLSSSQADTASTGPVDITGYDGAIVAVANLHGVAAGISQHAPGDFRLCAVIHYDGCSATRLEDNPFYRNMRDLGKVHERIQHGNDRPAFLHRRWRPEIKSTRFAIQVPLAGRIELGQDIHPVEPLADAVSVMMVGWDNGDDTLVGIDGFDLLPLIGPIPEPVAVDPHVIFLGPAFRPVALVHELARLTALRPSHVHGAGLDEINDFDKSLVRPPCQRHGLILEEQLQAAALNATVIRQAGCFQVGLEHPGPGFGGEPFENRFIRHGLPVLDSFTADDPHFLARARAVDNRTAGASRVHGC